MNSLAVMIMPIALLFPAAIGVSSGGSPAADAPSGVSDRVAVGAGESGILSTSRLSPEQGEAPPRGMDVSRAMPWQVYFESYRQGGQSQVRIEQRVVVRISPRIPSDREDMIAQMPRARTSSHLEERPMGSCVEVGEILAVRADSDNRLILFLDDQRIVSARLEKACNAKDFYSGFYVDRHEDGKICTKRDKLQSRAGANCELSKLRELVEVRD